MRMGEGREVLDGGLGTGQVDVGWGGPSSGLSGCSLWDRPAGLWGEWQSSSPAQAFYFSY